jgi:hypothetical protein
MMAGEPDPEQGRRQEPQQSEPGKTAVSIIPIVRKAGFAETSQPTPRLGMDLSTRGVVILMGIKTTIEENPWS